MRKVIPVLLLLLLPSVLLAQGTVRVSSLYGPVEWKSGASKNFVPLGASTQTVQIGDQIRTGPGGTSMLELPDGSYMVVSENSTLTIQDFWAPTLKSLIDLMVGKVRFYIQRFGGRPNPYRVGTPTALIAVRGTIFEVTVDDALFTEVRCLEGRVGVESAGLPDREVILEQGKKTLVRPGEYPLTPVNNDEALAKNRVVRVVRKNVPDVSSPAKGAPSIDVFARDNDRRNRTSDPLAAPGSRTNDDVRRGKPTMKYPE